MSTTPAYPPPATGAPFVVIQGGALKFGGWYVARVSLPSGDLLTCSHKHESRGGALDCGWRLRAVAIKRGELAAEPIDWTSASRRATDS
jgi:hypothetical protein